MCASCIKVYRRQVTMFRQRKFFTLLTIIISTWGFLISCGTSPTAQNELRATPTLSNNPCATTTTDYPLDTGTLLIGTSDDDRKATLFGIDSAGNMHRLLNEPVIVTASPTYDLLGFAAAPNGEIEIGVYDILNNRTKRLSAALEGGLFEWYDESTLMISRDYEVMVENFNGNSYVLKKYALWNTNTGQFLTNSQILKLPGYTPPLLNNPWSGYLSLSRNEDIAMYTSGEDIVFRNIATDQEMSRYEANAISPLALPSWSSQNTKVSFSTSHINRDHDPFSRLFVSNIDGSDREMLVDFDKNKDFPATVILEQEWSSDDEYIYIIAGVEEIGNGYILHAKSGQLDLICYSSSEQVLVRQVMWIPNSSLLAYVTEKSDNDHELHIWNVEAKEDFLLLRSQEIQIYDWIPYDLNPDAFISIE